MVLHRTDKFAIKLPGRWLVDSRKTERAAKSEKLEAFSFLLFAASCVQVPSARGASRGIQHTRKQTWSGCQHWLCVTRGASRGIQHTHKQTLSRCQHWLCVSVQVPSAHGASRGIQHTRSLATYMPIDRIPPRAHCSCTRMGNFCWHLLHACLRVC